MNLEKNVLRVVLENVDARYKGEFIMTKKFQWLYHSQIEGKLAITWNLFETKEEVMQYFNLTENQVIAKVERESTLIERV